MNQLTDQQTQRFHQDGYLLIENAFDAAEVKALQEEADYLLELAINSSLVTGHQCRRLDLREDANGNLLIRKLQPVNDMSRLLTQTIQDERIVGPMTELMGDTPVLMEEKLNYKQPLHQRVEGIKAAPLSDAFPVHNDWAYYQSEGYPQTTLSSALLMDAFTPDNGPLWMWPGSHHTHLEHGKVENGLEVLPELIDHDGGIPLIAPAGSFLIFSSLVVHNSCPNLSGKPRRVMIYSHYPKAANMPPDVRNNWARLHEAPYERDYLRLKAQGTITDPFSLPHA
jgi:ectoine hydroxylase-related dioxygenase (phytanoyl-CoA dioxygenase family)